MWMRVCVGSRARVDKDDAKWSSEGRKNASLSRMEASEYHFCAQGR